MIGRELWTCPVCGRPFADRNRAHSCSDATVDDFLEEGSSGAVALFHRFRAAVEEAAGRPVAVAPARTRVGFQARTVYASVDGLAEDGLRAQVLLPAERPGPRFGRIERAGDAWAHHFRIGSPAEIDDEVKGWLREAYRHAGGHVGEGAGERGGDAGDAGGPGGAER